MKLFLISRTDAVGYDEYDSMVVSADSAYDAIRVYPHEGEGDVFVKDGVWMSKTYSGNEFVITRPSWVDYYKIDSLTVEFLGETSKGKGIIITSFNAG